MAGRVVYHPCACGHITLQHVDLKGKCKLCPCEKYRQQGRAHKYGAQATTVDGIRFGSKREAAYYAKLCLARKSGQLRYFLRQVPFHLPGGVVYRCDFMEVWANGETRFVDTKGFRTKEYVIKKKIVEATYPITITES